MIVLLFLLWRYISVPLSVCTVTFFYCLLVRVTVPASKETVKTSGFVFYCVSAAWLLIKANCWCCWCYTAGWWYNRFSIVYRWLFQIWFESDMVRSFDRSFLEIIYLVRDPTTMVAVTLLWGTIWNKTALSS